MAHPARQFAERIARLGQRALFQAKRFSAAPPQPGGRKLMVVVPRDQRDPATGERLAKLLEERGRDRERLRKRPVPQLDRVAEQHHLICALEPAHQPRANLGPTQQIRPRARAQMEIGDQNGQHATQYGSMVSSTQKPLQ